MRRSSRNGIFAIIMIAAAFAVGFYLAPSHQEIALMQMNDSNFSTAMQNFTKLRAEGNHSTNVLAPLISLNIHYGDVDQAITILESYLADNPKSIEGRKRLAQLYRSSQRFSHYCATLEELQKLAPSTDTLRELADTYDFLGRYEDEENALIRLLDSNAYKPVEDDYIKLASFYRIQQRPEDAISTIRDYIKDNHYKVGLDAAYLAVQLLLEHGKNEKALELASNYLEKHDNEDDALQLSTLFETEGQFDLAIEVLKPLMATDNPSATVEQQMADLLLAQKKDDEVYAMLSARLRKETVMAPSLAMTLTDLAIKRADYAMIERMIGTQQLERLPEEALVRYTDVSFRLKRPDLARQIQGKLSAGYLRDAPVLAAVLGVAANDTPQTMAALDNLPKNVIIFPEAKIVMANLYVQHDMAPRAFTLLDTMPIGDILDAFDAALYAQIYLDANAGAKAEQILDKARPGSPPEIQDSIDQVLLLLAAGEGKAAYVKEKLANYKGSESDFWPDAYDLASQYHHDDIALAIADQLFKTDPSISNRLQLAESLTINHRYGDATNLLQAMVEENDAARIIYLEALSAWAEESASAPPLSDAQKATLRSMVDTVGKNPNVSQEEKRDLAYVLEQIGLLDQAESFLIALAGDQPHDSPDVQDLIGFWQDHHSNKGRDWIAGHARKSKTTTDKVAWLIDLNDMEFPQAVIDVLHNEANMPPPIADQYIAALVELQDTPKLDATLQKAIETENGIPRLRQLATIAKDEDADSAAEKGWRKLHILAPDDNQAALELGMILFDSEHYDEARPLLTQYLQHGLGDYRASYAYAEILQQDEKKDEARPYYDRALQLISTVKEKNEDILTDQAYLLYRTDKVAQSIALFRELLAKYPQDKDLQATFAEVLIDTGQYDEASKLLSH